MTTNDKSNKPVPINSNSPSIADMLLGLGGEIATELVGAGVNSLMRNGGSSLKLLNPDNLGHMQDAGNFLQDARELAGFSVDELTKALDLRDESLVEKVENGTAALPFELVLRTASLVARHDPIPFVMRLARTYNPTMGNTLDALGISKLGSAVEREREFVNIYRKHDSARELSDEQFEKVLAFTNSAFEMALQLMEEGKVD